MQRKLLLKIETDEFTYNNGEVVISVSDSSEIKLIPNGSYMGFNWYKPLSLTAIKELVKARLERS